MFVFKHVNSCTFFAIFVRVAGAAGVSLSLYWEILLRADCDAH